MPECSCGNRVCLRSISGVLVFYCTFCKTYVVKKATHGRR